MLEEIRRFNRYYARVLGIFNKSYLDSGRSAAAVRILGEMERCPGITATEISALLDLDKSYLSRILSGFEKEGHLTRRQSPENWRAQELYLTASGLQLATELDRRADARIEGQLKGLSPEDTGQLLSAMHTIQTLLSPVILPEMEKGPIMTLQLGTIAQADLAMRFIEEAKAYLKAQGIDQWQTGYPDLPCIMQDLASGKGFFLQQEDGTHAGYVCIDFDGEPAYDSLCGTWLTGNGGRAYGVVHRLALSTRTRGQGLASAVFGILEDYVRAKGSRSLRMDTDDDNVIMKHLLSKHGYTCCGKIRFDNSDKIAYEKLL